MQKGAGSIMDYLCRNGMVMFFRKKLKGKKLRFEIESKSLIMHVIEFFIPKSPFILFTSQSLVRGAVPRNIKKTICDEHWTLEVKFPFQVTKTECSEMVEELLVDVHPGTIQDEFIQGEKYKVWMRSDIQSHSNQIPYPVKFVITKLERP